MSVADWALLASVVFSGLWSGLLAMLVLILHRMLAAMDGPGFAHFLHAFLRPRGARPSTMRPSSAWSSPPSSP